MGTENRNCCFNNDNIIVCTNYKPDFGLGWVPKVDMEWIEDDCNPLRSTERTIEGGGEGLETAGEG